MTKRLLIVLAVLLSPFVLGLLFTYDILKIEWISGMEIQPSYNDQEDPLPIPPRSIPVDGAAYVSGLGAPANPVKADEISIQRGKVLYENSCALCHGVNGDGKGPFAVYLVKFRPANLLEGNSVTISDGAIFMTITNGIEGRMPSLRENLPTARDRWDVVNYVRALQKGNTP